MLISKFDLISDDQLPDQSYKNDLFIVLYDVVEEQVVTVTVKVVGDVSFVFF